MSSLYASAMRFCLALALFVTSASADERAAFYGTWGTVQQCTQAPIKPGGTVRASPFEINDSFLKHGNIWCRLTWSPVEQRGESLVTGALALCGEDSAQGYRLVMELTEGSLSLRWGFLQINRSLFLCLG